MSNFDFGPKVDPVEPDAQAILALQRVSTGTDIHDTGYLLHMYDYCCRKGYIECSERFKKKMAERAMELAKRKAGIPK